MPQAKPTDEVMSLPRRGKPLVSAQSKVSSFMMDKQSGFKRIRTVPCLQPNKVQGFP